MARNRHRHTRHPHDRRKWSWTPVMIDPRCDDGEPVRCFSRFPDNFVAEFARRARAPKPPALYMANANPGPRNELGDTSRRWLCLECSTKQYDLAGAVAGARSGFVMVRIGDEWRACTWDDFGGRLGDEYREPF